MPRIRLHPLFIALGIALFLLGSGFVFIAYFITMTAHEMAHSAVAAHMGYVLDDVNMMPYGAVLSGETDMKPGQEILVAAAGPAANLVLAVIFTALWWIVPATYFFTETFVTANVVTAAFNFLPVFPLDGGRVLLAALTPRVSRGKAMKFMKFSGYVFAALFTVLAAASIAFGFNVTYAVIAVFMLTGTAAAGRAARYTRIKALSNRARALQIGIQAREVCIGKGATLWALNRLMQGAYYYRINIMDNNMRVVARIDEIEFEGLILKHDLYDTLEKALKLGGRSGGG
jgi:stage IV sporulation protein FB